MKSKAYLILVVFVFTLIPLLAFSQETLTITTYYPSPYGSYVELRANQMSIGSAYRSAALNDGYLIVWQRVGIATQTPDYALDVTGSFGGTFNGTNQGQVQLVWCGTCTPAGYYAYAVYQ